MVTKINDRTVPIEEDEKVLSALVLSSTIFVISLTKNKEILLRTEGDVEIYLSATEAAMLSLAFQQACEELAE
ncbi:hypothetical protein PP747_gp051 [Rhizobium phage RHph_Y38]|uniref:Uncharacterized protein n=1 Tax=Rhizobium phage RHph_Y38 TaxID=2509781 RepID=A0A7S5QX68_9CAUD|nr:hypothetical protein PP747_gp051 [Rhizobium phage RHph_Y38]QIG67752.1 hypothetical protein EVB52_051 [Rhizobium phage RHph_Y38]